MIASGYETWPEAGPSRLPYQGRRRVKSRGGKKSLAWTLLAAASTLSATHAGSATPGARWGQASTLFGDCVVIHGGKTNGDSPGGGGYTFTSGPNTGEMLILDLTQSFSAASPPWTSINASTSSTDSPSISFHTISPIQQGSQMMVFGGDVLQTALSSTGNNSAYMVDLSGTSASWSQAESSWGQPIRRIHHSAETDGKGSLWIVGGEKDDGSMDQLDELWMFNQSSTSPAFEQQSAPPGGLVAGTATLLSDDTILSLGGQNSSGLQSFTSLSSYSIEDKAWFTVATDGANSTSEGYPAARQGHVAVSLPNKRVFIHGGASSDWSVAMGDAWILDWSQSPPKWSEIDTTYASGVPTARYGHSAVALGERIVMMFGWAGNNPADAQLYVFDASTLTTTSAGVLSGGTWSSTYTPDSSAISSGSNSGSSSSGTGKSSGSSSSSSSSSSGSSKHSGSKSTSTEGPSGSSSGSPQPADPTSENNSDQGQGKKAGAALGALLGLGLVAGAGYMVYRRRHPNPDDYRHGDGASGLLRGSNHYYGADDDPYMLEKGMEYTGVGAGGVASFQQGTKPMGPRMPVKNEMASSPWSMANIGHAMEGSGPHLRERLALITGFGLGSSANTNQQRFDMLADEDDDRNEAFALRSRQAAPGIEEEEDEEDEEDRYNGVAKRVRERSYGRVEQMDDDDHEHSHGDLAGIGAHYHGGDFVTSPFEDDAAVELGGAGLLADAIHSRDDDEEYDDSDSAVHTIDTGDVTSNTSHANTTSSQSAQISHSSGGNSGAGLVSFSDSQRPRRGSKSSAPSPLVRRSPTWWDRFMGQSFLERSASGRLHPGPRAEEPIRDPAEPPSLSAIRESPRSAEPSAENPFKEDPYAADEMGRYLDPYAERHARSLSSLQSTKTATSSVMEARLQNMDVVQRAGTVSSRRTYSSSRSASSGGVSRNVSVRSSAGHPYVISPISPLESTPGSIIFDPSEWNNAQIPGTVQEQDEGEEEGDYTAADESLDIVDLNTTPVMHSGGRKRSNTTELMSPMVDSHDSTQKRSKTSFTSTPFEGREAKIREASDAPSITPSTTKRARQNRQLTTPVSPQPNRVISPPVRGSVLDRVKAIELRKAEEGPEALLPIPRSPAAGIDSGSVSPLRSPEIEKANMFVPGRGGRPIPTKINTNVMDLDEGGSAEDLVTSPIRIKSPSAANKQRYTHGMVPKPQLFVANPDGRQGSADS